MVQAVLSHPSTVSDRASGRGRHLSVVGSARPATQLSWLQAAEPDILPSRHEAWVTEVCALFPGAEVVATT